MEQKIRQLDILLLDARKVIRDIERGLDGESAFLKELSRILKHRLNETITAKDTLHYEMAEQGVIK